MESIITGILHSTFLVADTGKSLEFYQGILGLQIDQKRHLDFNGAWLWTGQSQIHLMELPNPDPVLGRPQNPGRDRHTALSVSDLQALENSLRQNNYPFSRSSSGRNAIFLRDPDGNGLEFIQI